MKTGPIGNSAERVTVIAEAGVNHNGSLDRALALVDAAAAAGADAVKFQAFRAACLATAAAEKAAYQAAETGAGGQREMLEALELSENGFRRLADHCRDVGIIFLASPFDPASLRFLVETVGVDRLKLGSGELTNAPLLHLAACSGLPLILSTGMSTLGEVERALAVLALGYHQSRQRPTIAAQTTALSEPGAWQALRDKVTLLHCTTEYPAPLDQTNLRAMDTLAAAFGLPVGFSDHTPGITAAVAAVARGACVLEKHFTLDRNLPGPDHKASLDPPQLAELVQSVRTVESALGDGYKAPAPAELANIPRVRRSLVATAPVQCGEPWSEENLAAKRPTGGLDPVWYWDLLGRPAQRNYVADEALDPWEPKS